MRIVVYDCVTGDALTDKYGDTGSHVMGWIAPHLPEAELLAVHVAANAPMPVPEAGLGVIVSGSEMGVYDSAPWIGPLRENLLAHRLAGTPIFGICFGHQIMADTFGGKAEKVTSGFAAGVRSFSAEQGEYDAYVAHQDQVTAAPPAARVAASAPYCPVAALAYDFPALSVQFHPEYNRAFATDLIDMFGAELMTPEQIRADRETLSRPVPDSLYTAEVAAFFRKHLGGG